MAKTTSEPTERTRFLDYASIYAQLSEQSERQEVQATGVDTEPSKQE